MSPTDAIPTHGDAIGPYLLQRELGRGGQGVVYLAVDTRLSRPVALKLLSGFGRASPATLERFRREAEAASKVDHPSVCTIYESGDAGGVPFIAMRYVEGTPLGFLEGPPTQAQDPSDSQAKPPDRSDTAGRGIPRTRPELDRLLSLFEHAALGLHAAHEAGIIHRDIKPRNILVTREDRPVICDFGLARDSEGELATLTSAGDLFGTPAYMSPEQLRGHRLRIDARTDVWSLGVSLFECLTGRLPFMGPSREALFRSILEEEPPDPRELNPAIRRDLAVVIGAALEKEPDRRYLTAKEFANDLTRARLGHPIAARPAGVLLRMRRWVQRNPALFAALSLAFIFLLSGLVATFLEKTRADRNARLATDHLEEYERLADSRRLETLLQRADGELWPTHPSKALALSRWITEAEELLLGLPQHVASLEELRSSALPYDEAARATDRASSPDVLEQIQRLTIERAEAERQLEALETVATRRREERREILELRSQEIREELAPLEARLLVRKTWSFTDPRDAFRHHILAELVQSLRRFGADQAGDTTLESVRRRLALARAMQQQLETEPSGAWDRATAAIRESPYYHGLRLPIQVGLVPIGPDPASGLWEFADTQTGDIPERGAQGKLQLTDATSLVFVLIPEANTFIGAQATDPTGRHYDPNAQENEAPAHEVHLEPYFLSKYEMTQGQWLRFMGSNPSFLVAGSYTRETDFTLRNPVEMVSWIDCAEAMRRLGMTLPSEAQWEHGCRAQSPFAYTTGDDPMSLQGFANIADEGSKGAYIDGWTYLAKFSDGFPSHAPVGSFAPNKYGLHDMHGNVWEWTDGLYAPYTTMPGMVLQGQGRRITRGGSFDGIVHMCRSAKRNPYMKEFRNAIVGVRPARLVLGR